MDPSVTGDLEGSTLTPICSTWVYTCNAGKAWQPAEQDPIELIQTKDYLNISKISDWDHLTDENWHEWKERMERVFINCDITGYISGDIKQPEDDLDPNVICNWDKNNTWAQQVIIQNVTSQMNHVGLKISAEAMYSALMVTHENKAHQMVNHIQCHYMRPNFETLIIFWNTLILTNHTEITSIDFPTPIFIFPIHVLRQSYLHPYLHHGIPTSNLIMGTPTIWMILIPNGAYPLMCLLGCYGRNIGYSWQDLITGTIETLLMEV